VHPFLLRLRPQPPGLLQEQRREAILGPQIHPPAAKAKALRRGEGSLGVSDRASATASTHAAAAGDGRRKAQPPVGFRWDASGVPVAIGEEELGRVSSFGSFRICDGPLRFLLGFSFRIQLLLGLETRRFVEMGLHWAINPSPHFSPA
jgi:hypothetical protein